MANSAAHIDMSAFEPKSERQRAMPSPVRPKVSVADLVIDWPPASAKEQGHVPIKATVASQDAYEVPWDRTEREIALDGIRGGLRRFQTEHLSGADKHSQMLKLIKLCLDQGVSTGKEVVDMVGSLGFDRKQVGMMLARETDSTVGRHRWRKGGDGTITA